MGLVTYAIVFNLNLIVRTCAQSYGKYKAYLVGKMRQDHKEVWRRRGECFDVFRPTHESEKPTELFVLLYVLRQTSVDLRKSSREDETDKSGDPGGVEDFGALPKSETFSDQPVKQTRWGAAISSLRRKG